MYSSGTAWAWSGSFHPFIDTTVGVMSMNRADVTVVHRSGEITNTSSPDAAAFSFHDGDWIEKFACAFVSVSKMPPPIPLLGVAAALHRSKTVPVMFSFPPAPSPSSTPHTPPPPLALAPTLHELKLHELTFTTAVELPRSTLTAPPSPAPRETVVKFDPNRDSVEDAPDAMMGPAASVEEEEEEEERVRDPDEEISTSPNAPPVDTEVAISPYIVALPVSFSLNIGMLSKVTGVLKLKMETESVPPVTTTRWKPSGTADDFGAKDALESVRVARVQRKSESWIPPSEVGTTKAKPAKDEATFEVMTAPVAPTTD
jgi:hypothetical protein